MVELFRSFSLRSEGGDIILLRNAVSVVSIFNFMIYDGIIL